MTDLGWENEGGLTAANITMIVDACRALKHKREETHEGYNGTQHNVSCHACEYVYHYDSGD